MRFSSFVWAFLPVVAIAAPELEAIPEPGPEGPPTSFSLFPLLPNTPFRTETFPVSAHRSRPTVTTSLTNIPPYTPSPHSTSPVSIPTSKPKHTGPPLPHPTETLPACKKVQFDFPPGQGGDAAKAEAVKGAYVDAWNAFREFAFPKDELLPLTKSGIDDWFGWGVTVVDGIDTAIVMNLTDIVAEQLAFIEKIDFTTTATGPVEIFDTNIRYLGGLLSAYDMLKSGQFPAPYPKAQIDALLKQAVILADKIAFGFDSPTGLAASDVDFTTNTPVFGTFTVSSTGTTFNATNTASTGTFVLEWARLSDLTGNETYRQLTERANSFLVNPNPPPVFPGLVGTQFDVDTGNMLTFDGGWHSEVDSFLEYLIKTFQYKKSPTTTGYKNFWLQATQSTIEFISLAPHGFPDLKFISALDVNGSITYSEDSFTCFCGGNFLLGGALLGMPQLIELGISATDSCHQTYNQTLTGLGPIGWAWYNASDLAFNEEDNNDAAERKTAAKMGFFIPEGDESWEFRPEEIESIFYAHRITGDPRWAEYNWQIFQAIQNTAKTDVAYATVDNVNMPFGGTMSNNLDSFFFAEVLKYLYLSFTDPDVINLEQWVFNTESHPFLAQCGIGAIDDAPATEPATASSSTKKQTTKHTTKTTAKHTTTKHTTTEHTTTKPTAKPTKGKGNGGGKNGV